MYYYTWMIRHLTIFIRVTYYGRKTFASEYQENLASLALIVSGVLLNNTWHHHLFVCKWFTEIQSISFVSYESYCLLEHMTTPPSLFHLLRVLREHLFYSLSSHDFVHFHRLSNNDTILYRHLVLNLCGFLCQNRSIQFCVPFKILFICSI